MPETTTTARAAACPYCDERIERSDERRDCSACDARHHRDCWRALPGCSECGERQAKRTKRAKRSSKPGKAGGRRTPSPLGDAPSKPKAPLHTRAGIASLVVVSIAFCAVALFELIFLAVTFNPRATEYAVGATGTMAWIVVLTFPTVALILGVAGASAKDRNRTTGVIGLIASVVLLLGGILTTFELGRVTPARERRQALVTHDWLDRSAAGGPIVPGPIDEWGRPVDPDAAALPAGESLEVTWESTTAGRSGETAGGGGALATGFTVVGEADPDYDPDPSADRPLGGPRSLVWARSAAAIGAAGHGGRRDVRPRSNRRFLARMKATDDARTVVILDANRPGEPREATPEADVSAIALSGNRVLLTHGKSPFLTVIDAATGEIIAEKQIPQGAASHVAVDPRNPRLAYLYAGGEFVGFDAGRTALLGSYAYQSNRSFYDGRIRFEVGGGGRYVYAWQLGLSPAGVYVIDAQQGFSLVLHEHDSWRMQPDASGRFVFTSNGVYRAGLTERIDETPLSLLGELSDGNLLTVHAGRGGDAAVSLRILDPRTAETVRTIELTPPPVGDARYRRWNVELEPPHMFLAGADRVVVTTRQGEAWYLDVPTLGDAVAAGDALPIAPVVPGKAFFGETWRVPIDPERTIDGMTVTIDAAPRGVRWDADARAVLWTPSRIQKGEHHVQLTVSAPGHDDLTLTGRVEARYRVLALTQATAFGVLPSERFIWWTTDSELRLMDPVTRTTTSVSFDEAPSGLVEVGGKLFTALRETARIVEIDPDASGGPSAVREYKHSFPSVEGLAAHPDGQSLSCVSSSDAGHLLVCRLPIAGGAGQAWPVMGSDAGPRTHAAATPWGRGDPHDYRLAWLDDERFTVANVHPQAFEPSFGRGDGIPVYRWTDEGTEPADSIAAFPSRRDAEGRLYLPGAVLDADGSRLKTHESAVMSPSADGDYYAAIGIGGAGRREASVRVSFFDLPNASRMTSMSFELDRGSYANGFNDGWLVSRSHVILARTTTSFTEGFQVWFLPYEDADLGR